MKGVSGEGKCCHWPWVFCCWVRGKKWKMRFFQFQTVTIWLLTRPTESSWRRSSSHKPVHFSILHKRKTSICDSRHSEIDTETFPETSCSFFMHLQLVSHTNQVSCFINQLEIYSPQTSTSSFIIAQRAPWRHEIAFVSPAGSIRLDGLSLCWVFWWVRRQGLNSYILAFLTQPPPMLAECHGKNIWPTWKPKCCSQLFGWGWTCCR